MDYRTDKNIRVSFKEVLPYLITSFRKTSHRKMAGRKLSKKQHKTIFQRYKDMKKAHKAPVQWRNYTHTKVHQHKNTEEILKLSERKILNENGIRFLNRNTGS